VQQHYSFSPCETGSRFASRPPADRSLPHTTLELFEEAVVQCGASGRYRIACAIPRAIIGAHSRKVRDLLL
jgi:hypothetical protein